VPVPVPYANLADPQSLNLYSYAGNRPTVIVDDGHDGKPDAPKVDKQPPKKMQVSKRGIGNGQFVITSIIAQTTITTQVDSKGQVSAMTITTTYTEETETTAGFDGTGAQTVDQSLGSKTSNISKDANGQVVVKGENMGQRPGGPTIETTAKVVACAMELGLGCAIEGAGTALGRSADEHGVTNNDLGWNALTNMALEREHKEREMLMWNTLANGIRNSISNYLNHTLPGVLFGGTRGGSIGNSDCHEATGRYCSQ